jgi:hypothetical protein
MNRHTQARISTGFLNTVDDVLPGTIVQNNTGVPQYPGLLGAKYRFDRLAVAKHWKTSGTGSSAAPVVDLEVQYVQMASDAAVTPARGVLCYWKDKANFIVSTTDTAGYRFAGVLLGTMTVAQYCYIAKVGEVAMKFKSSTTKVTPAVGDTAVGVSGNAGLADVLADATAQTYGTDETNLRLGTLTSVVATQIATVAINVID